MPRADENANHNQGEKAAAPILPQVPACPAQPLALNSSHFPAAAFNELPKVTEVPSSTETEVSDCRADASLEQFANLHHTPCFVFRFPAPAHFPYPRFGAREEVIPDEGVVIYEGMQFVCTPQGLYEVRFTATSPTTPVTLRLQLQVLDKARRSVTITLPPIRINPPREHTVIGTYGDGNCLHRSYHVTHRGFSPLVAGPYFPHLSQVARSGTARFGSLPRQD